MIRLGRALPLVLLCLPLVGNAEGADGGTDGADPGAPVFYISVFDGTPNRRWIPEKDFDPSRMQPGEAQHGQHGHHPMMMYEVTRYPEAAEPTEEQRRAAASLVERSWLAAKKHGWLDYNKAQEDGFHVRGTDPTHFRNDEFVLDDHILDPDRPEFLMFVDTTEGRKLSGFMYLTRARDERGPQIGGPLTIWHYHIFKTPYCVANGVMWVADLSPDGTCAEGEPETRSPEMMHVWFLDRADGRFATRMFLGPEQRRQLADRDD